MIKAAEKIYPSHFILMSESLSITILILGLKEMSQEASTSAAAQNPARTSISPVNIFEEDVQVPEPLTVSGSRPPTPIPGYRGGVYPRSMGPYAPIAITYGVPENLTTDQSVVRVSLGAPQDVIDRIDGEIISRIINTVIARLHALTYDQLEVFQAAVNAKLERLQRKFDQMRSYTSAVEDMVRDAERELGMDYKVRIRDLKQAHDLEISNINDRIDNAEAETERVRLSIPQGINRPAPPILAQASATATTSAPAPPPAPVPTGILAQLTAAAQAQAAAIQQAQAAAPAPLAANIKVPPPPEFSGSEGKISAKEFTEKMGLYFRMVRIFDDQDRILQALFRLTGDTYKFMTPLIEKAGKGENLGTWEEFAKVLTNQYGKKTDKELARHEI